MIYWIDALMVVWIVTFYRAYVIYKQKMVPEYEILPQLRRSHENMGFVWSVLLLVNLGLRPWGFVWLLPSAALVVITGIRLRNNKPTAVFVHVAFVLLTTFIALGILLKVCIGLSH